RFRDGHAVYHLVLTAIRQRLQKQNLTPPLRFGPAPGSANGNHGPSAGDDWSLTAPAAPSAALPFAAPPPAMPVNPHSQEESDREALPPPEPFLAQPPEAGAVHANGGHAEAPATLASKVMQVHDAYLVVETPEGMLVIDQHALHERILFEQLKARLRSGPLETQRLLIPEPVDLTAEQAARTLEAREELAALGLGVDDFGGGTVLVTSYPSLLSRRSPATILKAVVDHLGSQDRPPSREVLFNDLLSLMACHAAVRAGDRLTQEQIAALIGQRHLVDDTHHCPHGRPT